MCPRQANIGHVLPRLGLLDSPAKDSYRYTMLRIKPTLFWKSVVVAGTTVAGLWAQPSYPPPNEGLPNPYRTVLHWAQLPAGRHWGSTAGVAVAPDGKIWQTERCGNQHSCFGSSLDPILEFDESGKSIGSMGSNLFDDPHGIMVDKDGNVWVTDERVSEDKKRGVQVIKLSPAGKVLLTLGKAGVKGTGPDAFGAPDGIAQAANGDIYIADGHDSCDCPNARIMKFTKDGKFIK